MYIQSAFDMSTQEKINHETNSLCYIKDGFSKIVIVGGLLPFYVDEGDIVIGNVLFLHLIAVRDLESFISAELRDRLSLFCIIVCKLMDKKAITIGRCSCFHDYFGILTIDYRRK